MDESVPYQTFSGFRPHFDALARVAYYKLVPKPTSNVKHVLHLIYRVIVWIIVLTYNLQHFIRVIQVRDNTDQIVNILFILLTTLSTLAKQLAFNIRSRDIDHIIDMINSPVFAPKHTYHEKVMKENAVMMQRLLWFYIGCIFSCGTLWTIFPLVNKALGEEVDFTAYFPFDTNKSPQFEIVVAYMNIFITFQAYGNVTMDCTIVAFYTQAKVQLQILRYNLEHLVDDVNNIKDNAFTKDLMSSALVYRKKAERESKLKQKFVQCVTQHQQIKRFVKKVEATFVESLMFQFFVIAWVICMTVYKIAGLYLFSAEFFSMAMYLGCMLAQLFIYCYYGTQVQYESEFVNQSVYCSGWLSLRPAFRRQLFIMMEICKRPITPRIAYIIPISLETYVAVLRASYTLFTFLDRK